MLDPMLIPLVIIGSKYDVFQVLLLCSLLISAAAAADDDDDDDDVAVSVCLLDSTHIL